MSFQEQVFGNPDLVERLLSFLDADSILRLAESRISCTLHLLQHTSTAWNKLVKRRVGMFKPLAGFVGKRALILPLVHILQMLDDPDIHTLDLLEVICAIPTSISPWGWDNIKMSCPRHSSHSVPGEGFLLLEEIEAALGSALQEITSIQKFGEWGGPVMAALASRASRQQRKITRMVVSTAACSTKRSAEDLSALLLNCEAGQVREYLNIEGNIETDGWAALGKAFSSDLVRLGTLQVYDRKFMTEGRREDIRSVWDSAASFSIFDAGVSRVLPKSEEGWKALEETLDRSEEEEIGVEQPE